jgi:cytidylate kinase
MRIALCGYLGSGCTEVAEILASEFSLQTYNTSKILESVKDFDSLSRSGEIDMDDVVTKKLDEILKGDNIIVEGRSAFLALNRKGVIRVFLNTPFEDRVKHVAERRGIRVDKAREDVNKSDEERNHLLQRSLGKDCIDITSYDLTLNTSSKTYSLVAKMIADFIRNL